MGENAGARHPRPARQHLRPARQHARSRAGAEGARCASPARRLRAADPFPRRLDLRPARRRHRVPARQRRDVPHARVAPALHRCGGGGRRGAWDRSGAIAAPRAGRIPVAARFLPEAGDRPPAAARRRGDLSLRRDAHPRVERRGERRRSRRPGVPAEVVDRAGAAGRQRHVRARHREPRRYQHAAGAVAADRRSRGRTPRRGRAAALCQAVRDDEWFRSEVGSAGGTARAAHVRTDAHPAPADPRRRWTSMAAVSIRPRSGCRRRR